MAVDTEVPNKKRERMIRAPELLGWVGMSRTTIFRLVKAGSFPSPVRLHGTSIAWRESDVDKWIATRPSVAEKKEPENER